VTATQHDPEIALTGLPSGRRVKVIVSALNDAGEGPATTTEPLAVP